MIEIEWVAGQSKGTRDLLPDYVLAATQTSILVHRVLGAGSGRYQAKCRVVRAGTWLDLDYGPFQDFNDPRGMYLGVMRLALGADGFPSDVLWRDDGKTSFSTGLATVRRQPGADFVAYDIRAIERSRNTLTQKEQLIAARLGQGLFREGLMTRWQGACALTGLQHGALLRASHVKPWSKSTDAEQLDPSNGLLLAAHVDALFDRHLITFDGNGKLHWADEIAPQDREILALPEQLRSALDVHEKRFMRHHSKIFALRATG